VARIRGDVIVRRKLTRFGALALCQKIAVDLPYCNMQTLCHASKQPTHADGALSR